MPDPKRVEFGGPGIEGRIDKQPMLAVYTSVDGAALALPPGTIFMIIEGFERPDQLIPARLVKVAHGKIEFACACNRPGCTRTMRYKAVYKGVHPQRDQ